MKTCATSLAGIFEQFIDAAIIAAIFYAAGLATAETGLGAVVGFLGGSGTLVYMMWLAEEAYAVVKDAIGIFDSIQIAVTALQQFAIDSPDLPTPTAYDNPGV